MSFSSLRLLKAGFLLVAALAVSTLSARAGETAPASSKDKTPVIEKPKTAPRFYVDLLAGGEFDTGATDFIGNGSAIYTIESSTLLPPIILFGAARPNFVQITTLPVHIQARDFNETHDAAVINGRLELGYKVLPYLSVFVNFTYSHAGGNDHANVGFVDDAFGGFVPAGGRIDLYADVGRYQAFAGRAGFKINTPRTILDFLHLPRAIKPYASFSAGGKYLDSQSIRFYTVNLDPVDTGGRLKLYDASWVFSVEGSLGYDLQLTRNFSVFLENGYGYDAKPDSGNLKSANYLGVGNKGSRVYSTVNLGAKLSF